MKKVTDTKKRLIILVVFIVSVVIGINVFITRKKDNKIISIEEELTAESYVDYVKNHHNIDIGEVGCSYTYNEYTIDNNGEIIIIGKKGNKDTRQMLVGSDFILTKNKIWFTNNNRVISAFDFTKYNFSNSFPYDYEKSSTYQEYGNADLNTDIKVDRWIHHFKDAVVFNESHLVVKNDEVIADTNKFFTILFDGRKIVIYKNREIIKEIKLPFYLKEIAYLSCKNGSTYEFINSDDAVGTIKIWDLGYCLSMVDETPKERHLFSSSKDYMIKIRIDEGYAIYYEEGFLMGGNTNMHFRFDNLPNEIIVIGNYHGDGGIGKGIDEACFATGYQDENLDEYLEEARKLIDF